MLQNLKEIVGGNFPEDEIYVMLKECNMDPCETVHRLLNQDTFHEVKSRREKKKETKDHGESRSWGVNNILNRGGRGVTDYSGRIGSAQVSTSEFAGNRSKPIQRKENGTNTIPNSTAPSLSVGDSCIAKCTTPVSDYAVVENTRHLTATADTISLQYSGVQSAWSEAPAQRTLADIVKMGRPTNKTFKVSVAQIESYTAHSIDASMKPHASADSSTSMVPPSESHHENHVPNVSETAHDPGASAIRHMSHDEWTVVDQSTAVSGFSLSELQDASAVYTDQSTSSNLLANGSSLSHNSGLEKMHVIEGNVDTDDLADDSVRPVAASNRGIQVDKTIRESGMDSGPFKNMNSYQSQLHYSNHHEVDDTIADVSSTSSTLQQLTLHEATQADDNPTVIFPNNMQITNPDCSHLSFGSFGSGISASFSGSFASSAPKCNLGVPSETADATSVDHSDARNSEYYGNEQLRRVSNETTSKFYGDEQLRLVSNETVDSSPSINAESYDMPSSRPDVIGPDPSDASEGLQHRFQPSVSDYTFSNTTEPNAASYASMQENSQMQNLASFSGVMQASTGSSSNNLSAQTVQPAREFDLPYGSLLAAQPTPTKFSTSMSSISGPSISMLEVVKPGVFSTPQTTQQNLSTATIPTGLTAPQHLPVQSYSQSTLPLGHFANIIGYPFLPQSYTYVPSAAFQQAFSSNGVYNQSPAAVNAGIKYTLPQYKTSVGVSNLPQIAAMPSGLGGFGSSANILGNFALNPSSTASTSTMIGYDDVSSTRYKDGNHQLPLQQNENSELWLQGVGSRTMSSLPARTYYSLHGQNQLSGFRQSQQPSPYGAVGYPNFYHSQADVMQEHQQNAVDVPLNTSRGPASQIAKHIWQHNY